MRHRIIFSFLVLTPAFAFSQTSPGADSANQLILSGHDCSDAIFTRVETLPALKVSNREYADTLGAYLISNSVTLENKTAVFRFIVTCHGEIHSIESNLAETWTKEVFKKAILHYSNLWVPARQNGYIVNSYVSLTLEFDNNKLGIQISQ